MIRTSWKNEGLSSQGFLDSTTKKCVYASFGGVGDARDFLNKFLLEGREKGAVFFHHYFIFSFYTWNLEKMKLSEDNIKYIMCIFFGC